MEIDLSSLRAPFFDGALATRPEAGKKSAYLISPLSDFRHGQGRLWTPSKKLLASSRTRFPHPIRSVLNNPPHADEFEVSVFGPGRGECIVLHLGRGEWVIVDSCLDLGTREAVALRYLKDLGVDAASAVKLVVVTHWHDDHIKGVSQIVEAVPEAKFVCSEKDRLGILAGVATAQESSLSQTGFDEFSTVLQVLRSRKLPGQRQESVGPHWAAEGLILHQLADDGHSATVMALSPSPGTQTLALHEGFLARPRQPQRRAVALTPNQQSIVLWVTAGENSVLLGGDLEHSANPAVGWHAVVACGVRPGAPASVFKVPHHGSENADNPDVWTSMLTDHPFALVAPYASGRRPLPGNADISRLLERTDRLYCTTQPKGWKPARRDSMVERTVREVARNRRVISREVGQVRLRLPLAGGAADPSLELFGPAVRLTA